jgi:putative hydrolase of the HAD superfamily
MMRPVPGSAHPNGLQVVFFDVGGTLLHVKTSVGTVYAERAALQGISVSAADLDLNFRVAWQHSVERSIARNFICSDPILREEWRHIVRETFGGKVTEAQLEPLFDDLYRCFSSAGAWDLVPGARETFAHLKRRGLKLGVLSNWDSRLLGMLDLLEIKEVFDVLVISHGVGFEKPHREIFLEALRRAGTAPARALHVGDSYEADILPAKTLGMRTLWVAPEAKRESRPGADACADALPSEPVPFWDELISRFD